MLWVSILCIHEQAAGQRGVRCAVADVARAARPESDIEVPARLRAAAQRLSGCFPCPAAQQPASAGASTRTGPSVITARHSDASLPFPISCPCPFPISLSVTDKT